MGVLTLFQGGRDQAKAPVLLVVGVHREERAFGEAVAAELPAGQFDLLRIEHGLSGRRPGPGERDLYRQRHRALYAQIVEHIKPAHRLVVDLHTGFDEAGPCADVLCAETGLLACIQRRGPVDMLAEERRAMDLVRAVQLVTGQHSQAGATGAADAAVGRQPPPPGTAWPRVRPDIPDAVCCADRHLYIGLEIYLPDAENDSGNAVGFGAAVVRAAVRCGQGLLAAREPAAGR